MAKAKKLATSASIAKKCTAATENLMNAKMDSEASVSSLEIERKKLLVEKTRQAKKTAVLTKKKKLASARLKKTPDAVNRKAVAVISQELAAVKKLAEKTRAAALANAAELTAIKASLRQASAYLTAMAKIDRLLNKPKKKRVAKKRVSNPAVKLSVVAA